LQPCAVKTDHPDLGRTAAIREDDDVLTVGQPGRFHLSTHVIGDEPPLLAGGNIDKMDFVILE
jgi:hypothetical protein